MALVKCPECGRDRVSDTAVACPDCGFAIKEYFQKVNYNNSLNREKDEIEKNKTYKLIVSGFHDTDTAAMAGLTEVLEMELSYEQAMDLFSQCPCIVKECDTEGKAEEKVKQLKRWGIDTYTIAPGEKIDVIPYKVSDISFDETYNLSGEFYVDRVMKILCFCIPLVGLIIYCLNVSKSRISAKICLKYSIAGFLIGMVLLYIVRVRMVP